MLHGGEVAFLPVRAPSFLPDLDRVPADALRRAKVLVVNYPNNPTGAVCDVAFLARCVAFAREHGLLLVSDLAYSELTFDGYRAPSVFEVPGARDVAVELHSCSKAFNMAGLRVGFVAGAAAAVDALLAYRSNVGYGTPWIAQAAARTRSPGTPSSPGRSPPSTRAGATPCIPRSPTRGGTSSRLAPRCTRGCRCPRGTTTGGGSRPRCARPGSW
jgi:LL-diaminopimelate aminotransferase